MVHSMQHAVRNLTFLRSCILKLSSQKFHRSFPIQTAEVSKPAPNFAVTAVVKNKFEDIRLTDYKGKYVVLLFYPLDFTFVCPTEIIAFSDNAEEFRQKNAEVLAVSVDSPYCHLAWINTSRKEGGLESINIPLLSDLTKEMAKDYGVLLDAGMASRASFIIDREQIVRQITVNDNAIGRSVQETMRLIDALQHHEKHGEVCPVDWTPNSSTIKPDPVGAKAYFGKINY
nr:peroxiredoxin-2-like [Parasteatoda tepidariorum]